MTDRTKIVAQITARFMSSLLQYLVFGGMPYPLRTESTDEFNAHGVPPLAYVFDFLYFLKPTHYTSGQVRLQCCGPIIPGDCLSVPPQGNYLTFPANSVKYIR
jgi:hypothetical protein